MVMKMTSDRELTLNDILHVPDIRKNLVSGPLLSKNGFRLVFESDKFVLTRKGYLCDCLFKMNVMTMVPSNITNNKDSNKTSTFAYLIESPNLWHNRLGHVNFGSLKDSGNMAYYLR